MKVNGLIITSTDPQQSQDRSDIHGLLCYFEKMKMTTPSPVLMLVCFFLGYQSR